MSLTAGYSNVCTEIPKKCLESFAVTNGNYAVFFERRFRSLLFPFLLLFRISSASGS